MTALKAHEVARFVQKPDLTYGVFLAYGPDQGRVHETATSLIKHHAGSDDDPMSELTLDAAMLSADPSLLAVEARTQSMFGGVRRIRVRGATKALTPHLTELLEDMPQAVIVLEAGNLPPRDSLRALVEKHKHARALPCYADNDRDLSALIRQTFQDANIIIDPDASAALLSTLGNDREVSRRELEKLILFAADNKKLTRDDILTLCGDNAALAIDEIIDAAGTGRIEKFDTALARATMAGIDNQRLMIVALNHFVWLRNMRVQIDAGTPARRVLDGQRPRPHFSRRGDLEQQLRLWSDEALCGAINRLYDAIAESRKSSLLSSAIAQRALLAVCVAAAHR